MSMEKNSATFVFGAEIPALPAGEGVARKVLAYSESMMVCRMSMAKGAEIPMHQHIHEQSTTVLSGKGLYTVAGETKEVGAGDSVMVGPDVPHKLTILEDMEAIDVFTPLREEFLPE